MGKASSKGNGSRASTKGEPSDARQLLSSAGMKIDSVALGDCIERLGKIAEPCVDLVFADPPFNIGYEYDAYKDNVAHDEYVGWTRRWMSACVAVLKPAGSFYIAIGDNCAAEARIIGAELGLTLRNWIIWHYTFGQNTRAMFAKAHTHILYFVRDAKKFTFHDEQVRFPSARHTEYSDRRANPMGRVPDDVWNEFPRVCGTFAERAGWHGCQMPEALLMRIIRVSSDAGDLVLDPFVGSGTTVTAAAKLDRHYLGIDISEKYISHCRKRLRSAKRDASRAYRGNGLTWPTLHIETLAQLYRETGTAFTRLVPNHVAMDCFVRLLNARLSTEYTPDEVGHLLTWLGERNRLPKLRNDRPYRRSKRQDDSKPLFA
jgi:DNA modification methylase